MILAVPNNCTLDFTWGKRGCFGWGFFNNILSFFLGFFFLKQQILVSDPQCSLWISELQKHPLTLAKGLIQVHKTNDLSTEQILSWCKISESPQCFSPCIPRQDLSEPLSTENARSQVQTPNSYQIMLVFWFFWFF